MIKPKNIFIVEDEGIVAADLEERLTLMGYLVVGKASSGEEALKKFAEAKPDLILMDIIIQGALDGIQTAELVHQLHPIPVVFLTAHADDATMRRATGIGPFGYVLKPFDDREIRVAIEIALYRHETESQLRKLNQQLQNALDHIKVLHGLLPICAWCKKIRNDENSWENLEKYISSHSAAMFTHSICPDCLKKVEAENAPT